MLMAVRTQAHSADGSATDSAVEMATMGFSEVSSLLWQEREALELLLFKLVEERLIVAAGESKWLPAANREVETVVEQLRAVEVRRAVEVAEIVRGLGRSESVTLQELAALAAEPWAAILNDHRTAMLALVAELEQTSTQNRALLAMGARSIRETLLALTESVDTYDGRGVASAAGPRSVIMDEHA
jgi:hypothetical protein